MTDLILYQSAIRDLTRPKRLFWVCVLILIAPALALLVRLSIHNHLDIASFYQQLCSTIVYGFVLVLLSVLFATGAITSELEQKTIVYLLTRPVARWRILLAKYLAAVTIATLAAWLSLSLLAAITIGAQGLAAAHFWLQMGIIPLGVLAYSGVFLFIAALTGRTLVPLGIGIFYGFLWETIVPELPGNFKVASLMTYLHLMAKIKTQNQDSGSLFSTASTFHITLSVAWLVILLTFILSLMASLMLFSVKEYVPREETA